MWFNLRWPNNIWGWRQNMLRYQMSNYKLHNVPEVLSKSCHRACFYCSQVAWPWTSFLGYSAIESHFICKLVWYGVFITQGPRSQQTCPRLRHATWHFLSVGCSARWSFYRLNKRLSSLVACRAKIDHMSRIVSHKSTVHPSSNPSIVNSQSNCIYLPASHVKIL